MTAIRPLRPGEAAEAHRILSDALSSMWSLESLGAELARPGALALALEAPPGTLAGVSICRQIVPDEAELLLIAVAPGARRRGLGSQLLARTLWDLGRRGVRTVFLMVRESNVAAQQLYARAGFRTTRRSRGAYSAPAEDGLEMGLPLT